MPKPLTWTLSRTCPTAMLASVRHRKVIVPDCLNLLEGGLLIAPAKPKFTNSWPTLPRTIPPTANRSSSLICGASRSCGSRTERHRRCVQMEFLQPYAPKNRILQFCVGRSSFNLLQRGCLSGDWRNNTPHFREKRGKRDGGSGRARAGSRLTPHYAGLGKEGLPRPPIQTRETGYAQHHAAMCCFFVMHRPAIREPSAGGRLPCFETLAHEMSGLLFRLVP